MNNDVQTKIEKYICFVTHVRGLSLSSISHHRRHIKALFTYIQETQEKEKSLEEITIENIYDLIIYLKDRDRGRQSRYSHHGKGKMSTQTIKNYVTTLRQFFKRCKAMKYDCLDYSLIQSPRVQRKKIHSLTDKQLEAMLCAPTLIEHRRDVKLRNTLLIMVGYMMGLRIRETLSITFDELINNDGFINILGKGNKWRIVPVPVEIIELAKEYQSIRGGTITYEQKYKRRGTDRIRKYTVVDQRPDLVFTCLDNVKYGMPLDPSGINTMFRKYEKALGMKERVTYHMLRHTFGTHILKAGGDLKTAQEMLGHASIASTEHYLDVDKQMMLKAQNSLITKSQKEIQKFRDYFADSEPTKALTRSTDRTKNKVYSIA